MLAAFYEAPNRVDVRTTARPVADRAEVLVRVAACGICGTDQHILHGGFKATSYPFIGGHETVGTVVETGANVETVQIGDRVAIDPGVFCGFCFYCQRRQGNHCERWSSIGVTKDGGFAEFVRAPQSNVYHIGDLDFERAAFIEPISCVVFALQRMRIPVGVNALIYGAGTMGQLMLSLVKSGNAASVTIVDTKPTKLAVAKLRGANEVVLADGQTDDTLRDLSPTGFDVIIDCTGVPSVVEHMFVHARFGAKLLFFGVNPQDARISLSPYDVYAKDLEIYGSFALAFTFHESIALLRSGTVEVDSLVSDRLPIARFGEALSLAASGEAMKVLIVPEHAN